MARILYGNVLAEARGKLGGIVYSVNTGGQYTRTKVSGVQPRTEAQLAQRSQLAHIAKLWATIPEPARLAWKFWASQQRHRTRLGMTSAPTAQQEFQRLNMALAAIDAPLRLDPPTTLDPPEIAQVQLLPTLDGGINFAWLTNAGDGYTSIPDFNGTGGNPEVAGLLACFLEPTTIASIALTAGGAGYIVPPTVDIVGAKTRNGTATATVAGGSVTTLTLTDVGEDFEEDPIVQFGGPGAGATATAKLAPTQIQSIYIGSAGAGYTSAPTFTVTGGGGSGATVNCTIDFDTTALTLAFSPATIADPNTTLTIAATPPIKPGRRVTVRDYTIIKILFGPVHTGIDITEDWEAEHGDLPAQTGYQIGVRLRLTNRTTGAQTPWVENVLYTPYFN
jgi:hypothetical protein